MNWKSFAIGFVAGVALLSGISHFKARTQNVIKTWPEDYRKGMLQMAPWLTEAKVGRIGPFVAIAPKSFDAASEAMIQAMIQPAKEKNPVIYLTENCITINDSKKRAISIDYNPASGEFVSYSYLSDLVAGPTFVDKNLSGSLVRVEAPKQKK